MGNIVRENLILVGKAPAVLSGSSSEKIEFCTVSDILAFHWNLFQ